MASKIGQDKYILNERSINLLLSFAQPFAQKILTPARRICGRRNPIFAKRLFQKNNTWEEKA